MALGERSYLNDCNIWKVEDYPPTNILQTCTHAMYHTDTHTGPDTYASVLGGIIKLVVELLNIFIV